jgi:peptidoglycan/LPS O-acetylase OafA/YrhL
MVGVFPCLGAIRGAVFLGSLGLRVSACLFPASRRRLPFRSGALGDITYSRYLSHTPLIVAVLIFMNTAGINDRFFLSNPRVLIAYISLIIAVSIPWHRYFERPADRRLRAMAKSLRDRRSVAMQPIRQTRPARP